MKISVRMLCLAILFSSWNAFAGREFGSKMLETFSEVPAEDIFQSAQMKSVDWAQPPLGCVEEMIPHRADSSQHPCPNFSIVANPVKDWPADISSDEKAYWFSQRRGVSVCRSEEVLRRERENPGSMNPAWLELAWMSMDALRNQQIKIQAVYDASRFNGVPPHVLTGAVYQESLFSELGIADDGGNYSCGVEQINLIGWCQWMNEQSLADRKSMGWPEYPVECNNERYVKLSLFRPIYEIAKSRLNGLPEYRLSKQHFQNISLESFVHLWPAASSEVQNVRYQLIMSYVNNCSDARKGILAKAHELSGIYRQFVSTGFKLKDRYSENEQFQRDCREKNTGGFYPLHTGWLMAVAAYNAGPRSFDAIAHFNRWTKADMNDGKTIQNFNPTDIVNSLYWAGKYNAENDLIEFNGLNGSLKSWTWFKGCVAQRHIARVMQHVTLLPEFFVDSLEGAFPCARSKFGPNGELLETAVPVFRQKSSGEKP